MKIDQHPFATNMVNMAKDKSSPQAKILTSSSAKKSGAVDPKAQIAADEDKERTSPMLFLAMCFLFLALLLLMFMLEFV